ncbi:MULTISPECIES: cobalamin-binding protein [Pseudoalteromonas]|uniref:cobalamin-binding protein n=1 Tax=Pseudoalteromonas TaxID=53246 RepID=UPI0003083868|nr:MULTISPECIES: cobalamin-binding protein [Pseudoalteromonas]MCF6144762.1 vitamin B12 transport system substrate-binding protein [Pseudoalteromonas mariniglutinosa NCIMB 1770]TMN72233.1 cobalamin-binding protein [Pseudoalteromonas sp. S1727]
MVRLAFFLLVILHSFSVIAATSKQQLRIIALAPHIVENLYTIGAGEQIVGTVEYADFPAAANDIPRIGGHQGIQLEKLLALKPDLVLAWKTGSKAEDLARIERFGIDVAYSDASEVDKVPNELRRLGMLTGREQAAEQAAIEFADKIAAIRAEYQHKTEVAVFYQLWPEPMMTVGKNTWINQLIDICQGRNVFANSRTDYPQISIENVVVAKPEVIILPDEKSQQQQAVIDWSQWPEVPAVKYKQFISVNADLLHRFTTRMIDGLDDMCIKIDDSRAIIKEP